MRAQSHEYNQPHQWIAALAAIARFLAAELSSVCGCVRHADRRAVHAEQTQAFPAMLLRTVLGPFARARLEQPFQWFTAESLACLRDGAFRRRRTLARQRQVELCNYVFDRLVTKQSHP
jgi:hypothetical protein